MSPRVRVNQNSCHNDVALKHTAGGALAAPCSACISIPLACGSAHYRRGKSHVAFARRCSRSPLQTASDRLIRIWNVTSGGLLASIPVQSKGIQEICFSPNGKLLAATSGGTNLEWWDVSDLTDPHALPPLRGHTSKIKTVAFSPDGTILATGGFDNTLRLWDVALKRQLAVLRSHSSLIQSLAWSPDGNTIYTGSGDASCRIWQAPSWTEIEAHVARQNTKGNSP